MDCPRVRELIVFYLDGELGPDSIAQIAAHLDACPPCARTSERERAFVDAVRRKLSPPAAPPNLLGRIRDAISVEPNRIEQGRTRRSLLGWAAAACLLLLAGAFAVESFLSPAGVLHALALPAEKPADMVGTVVCVGCEAQDPRNPVPHVHCNGLKGATGELWTILENDRTREIIGREDLRGRQVHVRGTFLRKAHLVSVASLELR